MRPLASRRKQKIQGRKASTPMMTKATAMRIAPAVMIRRV